jgi:hypothetical protein
MKEYIIVSLYNTEVSIECCQLSIILPSSSNLYVDEITGNHQCGFRSNRSATGQISCIRQILEETNADKMVQ